MIISEHFGHGFPSSISEEVYERAPSPYDMFSGKPNYKDHNNDGFRGIEFINHKKDTLQIAFFGGSTGYNGNPTISDIIQKNLDIRLENTKFLLSNCIKNNIPTPVMYSSLNWYINSSSEFNPSSLIQAQRDYFGAHTVQLHESDEFLHLNWD